MSLFCVVYFLRKIGMKCRTENVLKANLAENFYRFTTPNGGFISGRLGDFFVM